MRKDGDWEGIVPLRGCLGGPTNQYRPLLLPLCPMSRILNPNLRGNFGGHTNQTKPFPPGLSIPKVHISKRLGVHTNLLCIRTNQCRLLPYTFSPFLDQFKRSENSCYYPASSGDVDRDYDDNEHDDADLHDHDDDHNKHDKNNDDDVKENCTFSL